MQNVKIDLGNYIYSQQDVLGKGSFAQVYKGYQKSNNMPVAIKLIDKQSFIQYPQLENLAANELFINRSIIHENIVGFYQSIQTQTHIIIIQEYCNEGTLTDLIKNQNITEKKAKIIIVQILKALQFLWLNGIIHRDLKSDNILINNGVFKIADFGLSEIKKDIYDQQTESIGNIQLVRNSFIYVSINVLKVAIYKLM